MGSQQQTFSFLLWDILGFDYGVIKEFNSTSHSHTHQSPSKKYEQQSSYQVRRISEGFFADFQKRTLLKRRAWERYCKMKFWPNFDNLEVFCKSLKHKEYNKSWYGPQNCDNGFVFFHLWNSKNCYDSAPRLLNPQKICTSHISHMLIKRWHNKEMMLCFASYRQHTKEWFG